MRASQAPLLALPVPQTGCYISREEHVKCSGTPRGCQVYISRVMAPLVGKEVRGTSIQVPGLFLPSWIRDKNALCLAKLFNCMGTQFAMAVAAGLHTTKR